MDRDATMAPAARDPRNGSLVPIRIWTAVVLLVGLTVILFTYRDYGITWDEPLQTAYGEAVLEYFRSGLEVPSDGGSVIEQLRAYGPAFEMAAALAYAGNPAAKYEIRHLLIALVALLAVVAVIRIAGQCGTAWASIYASLILVTLPRFVGHSFNNSKDVPFAVLFAWAVYAICRFAVAPARLRSLVACGLAIGSTLALRPGGMPLLLLLFACTVGLAATRGGEVRMLALRGAAAWVLAWVVMVSLWPWAHDNPVWNPLQAVFTAFHGPTAPPGARAGGERFAFPVLFEGRVTMSDALPPYYLAKYLLITTPPAVLALGLVGLARAVPTQIRDPRSPKSLALFAIEVWLCAPLLLPIVARTNVYDGMRHILFALPALAVLAGCGASALVEIAGPGWPRRAVVALLLGVCALPVPTLVRLHPYQMTYFNSFVGGLAKAHQHYETDYWLSSYKEAIEWVNQRASGNPRRRLRILVAIDSYAWDCAAHYLAAGVEMRGVAEVRPGSEVPEPFDYFVGTARYGAHLGYSGSPIVHTVGRDGAVFTAIRGRSAQRGSRAGRRSPAYGVAPSAPAIERTLRRR